MSDTWVLVADSSCAKIFKLDGSSNELHEVSDLVHSESKMREQEVTSDLPGRNSGGGESRHNLEGKSGIKEHEAINFAREIDAQLETARNNDQFSKLIVAADPSFLGVLRKNIHANTSKLITHEINKDLVKFSALEIRDHLPGRL